MSVDFARFFEDVWGHAPFPWQARLAATVVAEGWPAVLDLPTGAGKTAALDVALFHIAVDPAACRRVVLVVDRRVIVDQVGQRLGRLRAALAAPSTPTLRAVADALRARSSRADGAVVEGAILRGGIARDDGWARSPDAVLLAASTVDQIGSRLLFRGYGVSDGMRPIHAGLLGCDTLLLLDEVHLARPFADLVRSMAALDSARAGLRGVQVVEMSATPGGADGPTFGLDEDDREHPTLARRLVASKPAELVEVKVSKRASEADKNAAVAAQAVAQARGQVAAGRRAVAVVVNRVDTARRVAAGLGGRADVDVELLTGRMRPLDQTEVLARVLPRVDAGRTSEGERPLVLVATQCIEAGADFDFDGLVTECASIDALRQRFGRLDRRGERPGQAVILGRSDLVGSGAASDPVYGAALAATWAWLAELPEVDFGSAVLRARLDALGEGARALEAPRRASPVVLPAYLDQWSQTRPRPHADPDVALFLHGIPESRRELVPDVQVVWRADVTADELDAARSDEAVAEAVVARVSAAPPGRLEALALPPWTVRDWLGSRVTEDDRLVDVEGLEPPERERSPLSDAAVLVWRGDGAAVVEAAAVRPGDTIVVPADRGGLGRGGTFDPNATAPVEDLAEATQLLARGRPLVRLRPAVAGGDLAAQLEAALDEADDAALDVLADEVLARWSTRGGWRAAIARGLVSGGRSVLWAGADAPVVVGRRLAPAALRALLGDEAVEAPQEATTEGEDGSFVGEAVALDAHLVGVGARAAAFAEAVGLPEGLVATLRWAGRIHDVGKVDPRFQLLLHGGDAVSAASADGPLAKSPLRASDRAARQHARAAAGYRRGQRHELVSLAMLQGAPETEARLVAEGVDVDLLRHLVASHHGWCRPLAPPFALPAAESEAVVWTMDGMELRGETAHGAARLDSGVVDRFWILTRRFGWHGLAYLEAILRLADHRQSEEETHA